MEHTYKIAVLLTCHNRKEKTLACLRSLFECYLPENHQLEVFMVDDGSTDGTGEAVKIKYPQVKVIKGDGNLYWTRGMNLAWQTATETFNHDFYLWLNDDVILYDKSICILLEDFQNCPNKKTIIVGACQSFTKKVTYSGYIDLKREIILEPRGEPQKCNYFNGNVVLIPSPAFNDVGFLDTIFHHGQGDFDYGLRARMMGINSFVSSFYVGICEVHDELPKWCNPNYPLSIRWKSFRSPLGGRPKLTFIFQRRHLGIALAAFHYFTIYLRLIFPKIWVR